MFSEKLKIASQFRGPSNSANGGYVCGKLAGLLAGPAAVRLKAPPPLDEALGIERANDSARLMKGKKVIAEAHAVPLDLAPPPAPSFGQAQTAAHAYAGFLRHPFPQCFVCGPQREPGDGLRIFPGPVDGGAVVAAPWIPYRSLADGSGKVADEYLWAALDCSSAFAQWNVPEGKAIVLGELCARIDGSVSPGERCVVIGWPLGIKGRKRRAGSSIFSASGRPVAVARATWIEVPESRFAR
jgi:hypothetical protein